MIRILVLLIGTCALVACASGDWPTGKEMNAYDHPLVAKRYDAAITKALGTPEDIREIKAVVRNEAGELDQIRWRSNTEVILYVTFNPNASVGMETYYYVLRKEDGHWRIIARYIDMIS